MKESNENFSLVKRLKSFKHAFRGIFLFIKNTHNAWIHLMVLAIVVGLGFYFNITRFEWLSLVVAFALVLVTEAINTAIEIDIDLTSPQYHPYARDTKDVAAGAVLIAVFFAVIIGLFVFLPHLG